VACHHLIDVGAAIFLPFRISNYLPLLSPDAFFGKGYDAIGKRGRSFIFPLEGSDDRLSREGKNTFLFFLSLGEGRDLLCYGF